MSKEKSLVVVVGPTAVGKTSLAIRLAQHYGTSIVSADSRQFYRQLTIGTAKPSTEERRQAPHYFIDSHSIEETYSAGDFEREALALLEELFKTQDVVIVVGGSGLFIQALCEGLDELPTAPKPIRDALNHRLVQDGLGPLQDYLKKIDPQGYEQLDVENPQRVIRALEVFESSGRPMSSFLKAERAKRPFKCITVGINRPREELYELINNRVDVMMDKGLLAEVEQLLPYRSKPALLTVGYKELFSYLDGDLSLVEAVAKIKQNSRRYAKRQITWFKKHGNTQWFAPTAFDHIIQWVDEQL